MTTTTPATPPLNANEYVVTEALDGARLDKAVIELMKEALAHGSSRAKVKRAIEAGEVRVNGKRRVKGALVAKGDVISLEASDLGDPNAPAVATPDAALAVCFESKQVIVVDKPAGQPTAPLKPSETGTLANALVGKYPELAGLGYSPREPGLLHRLDTDTSGLVVVARTKDAFDMLKEALRDGRLTKEYVLVCASEGLPDQGTIEFPITNHPKDQRRVYPCVHPRDVIRYAPRPASTRYRMIRRGGPWALVEVAVSRALRHQIRAHFAAIEHPLAGDKLYGGADVPSLGRHALHASRVAFDGDIALAFDVRAKVPEAMEKLVPIASEA